MSAERLERLADLFDVAAGLDPSARASYLADACRDDPALQREVERLLAAHERAPGFIDSPPILPDRLTEVEALAPGRRIGAYRVVREIGRGGMGAVYLGERADGQFDQQVAIKLIKRGMDTTLVLGRFRAERQILASLDHPNIAHLLDGGTTEDGLPYFVMEHIDGKPIDEYADEQRLSIEERLALFLEVCRAVSYAHQRLVVHRDIKPLNILVTTAGVPKLLDFGIAKVLNADADDVPATLTGFRLLTPEYASPEQIEGGQATTASDVYSLGVVLYELLTGRSPYRPRSHAPQDVAESVRTTEPERPSAAVATRPEPVEGRRRVLATDRAAATRAASTGRLQRRLRGDLDVIVLTALRKEPSRRYQSVEQLAADVRRHLAGLPVRARPDTFRYRAGKFVRRNRVGVVAAALVSLALVGGTVGTAWQAHLARESQARAERRFNDVRQLANALLFRYHDAIKELPGATAVREQLLRDAVGYLDTLARESHGDPSLQRELASAYRRVGDLQGGNEQSNLGDSEGALKSYRKAMQLLEALFRSDSSDAGIRRDLASLSLALGSLTFDAGDPTAGMAYARRARTILAPLVTGDHVDTDVLLDSRAADDLVGVLAVEAGDVQEAIRIHRGGIARLEPAAAANPRVPRLRQALAVAHHHTAYALVQLDNPAEALEHYRRAGALWEQLAAEYPDNLKYATLGQANRYRTAEALAMLGRHAEALTLHRANVKADSESIRRDPKNAAHRGGLASSLTRVGDMLLKLGRPREALVAYRETLAIREQLMTMDSSFARRIEMIEARGRICQALARVDPQAAGAACARVVRLMDSTPIEPTNAGYRGYMAGAYSDVGEVYDSLAARRAIAVPERHADREAALETYRRSSAIWSDLFTRGLVYPADTGRVTAAARAVARAEAALRESTSRP